MSKFKPGDLVMIVANDGGCEPHCGKVGSVLGVCCWYSSLWGANFYHLTCLDANAACREDALKLIGGDGKKVAIETMRDAPVTA